MLPAARQYLLPSKSFANLVLDSNADIATVEKSLYDAIVEKRVLAECDNALLSKDRVAPTDPSEGSRR